MHLHLDKITLEITAKSVSPQGIDYSLNLENGCQSLIKQNNVYISFPIINGNGSTMNKAKIEAVGNKLDIQPGEKVSLNVFIPTEYYVSAKIDKNRPQYEIKGYINDVKDSNHFEKSGDFER